MESSFNDISSSDFGHIPDLASLFHYDPSYYIEGEFQSQSKPTSPTSSQEKRPASASTHRSPALDSSVPELPRGQASIISFDTGGTVGYIPPSTNDGVSTTDSWQLCDDSQPGSQSSFPTIGTSGPSTSSASGIHTHDTTPTAPYYPHTTNATPYNVPSSSSSSTPVAKPDSKQHDIERPPRASLPTVPPIPSISRGGRRSPAKGYNPYEPARDARSNNSTVPQGRAQMHPPSSTTGLPSQSNLNYMGGSSVNMPASVSQSQSRQTQKPEPWTIGRYTPEIRVTSAPTNTGSIIHGTSYTPTESGRRPLTTAKSMSRLPTPLSGTFNWDINASTNSLFVRPPPIAPSRSLPQYTTSSNLLPQHYTSSTSAPMTPTMSSYLGSHIGQRMIPPSWLLDSDSTFPFGLLPYHNSIISELPTTLTTFQPSAERMRMTMGSSEGRSSQAQGKLPTIPVAGPSMPRMVQPKHSNGMGAYEPGPAPLDVYAPGRSQSSGIRDEPKSIKDSRRNAVHYNFDDGATHPDDYTAAPTTPPHAETPFPSNSLGLYTSTLDLRPQRNASSSSPPSPSKPLKFIETSYPPHPDGHASSSTSVYLANSPSPNSRPVNNLKRKRVSSMKVKTESETEKQREDEDRAFTENQAITDTRLTYYIRRPQGANDVLDRPQRRVFAQPVYMKPGAKEPDWGNLSDQEPDEANPRTGNIYLLCAWPLMNGDPCNKMIWVYGPNSTCKSSAIRNHLRRCKYHKVAVDGKDCDIICNFGDCGLNGKPRVTMSDGSLDRHILKTSTATMGPTHGMQFFVRTGITDAEGRVELEEIDIRKEVQERKEREKREREKAKKLAELNASRQR